MPRLSPIDACLQSPLLHWFLQHMLQASKQLASSIDVDTYQRVSVKIFCRVQVRGGLAAPLQSFFPRTLHVMLPLQQLQQHLSVIAVLQGGDSKVHGIVHDLKHSIARPVRGSLTSSFKLYAAAV
jgi:hypothetical protein